MSLTSYRAAPPRVMGGCCLFGGLGRLWGFASDGSFWGSCHLGFLCWCFACLSFCVLGRLGGDLLSHALRRSTIGAEGFHVRVRDGIGCLTPRHGHQVVEARKGFGEDAGCLGVRCIRLFPVGNMSLCGVSPRRSFRSPGRCRPLS